MVLMILLLRLCFMLLINLSDVVKHFMYVFIAANLGPIAVLRVTLETTVPVATFTPLLYDFFT